MFDSVLRAPRPNVRRPVIRTLAVAAELALHGCRIRQARARPGQPSIEIEPPRQGLFETYALTIPTTHGIGVPIHCATLLRGVRVTWTPAGEPGSGSQASRRSRRERAR
jgi:hypothetical protein